MGRVHQQKPWKPDIPKEFFLFSLVYHFAAMFIMTNHQKTLQPIGKSSNDIITYTYANCVSCGYVGYVSFGRGGIGIWLDSLTFAPGVE